MFCSSNYSFSRPALFLVLCFFSAKSLSCILHFILSLFNTSSHTKNYFLIFSQKKIIQIFCSSFLSFFWYFLSVLSFILQIIFFALSFFSYFKLFFSNSFFFLLFSLILLLSLFLIIFIFFQFSVNFSFFILFSYF